MGYLSNPNNFLVRSDNGTYGTFAGWGMSGGTPVEPVYDAYGSPMKSKNVDKLIYNGSGYNIFLPNKTVTETNRAFKYIGNISGIQTWSGYVYNPTDVAGDPSLARSYNTDANNRKFWSNTAEYGSGPCWNGPSGGSYNTPPACPAGFTDGGIVNSVTTPYSDWQPTGGGQAMTDTDPAYTTGRLYIQSYHTNASWQFYNYFTWGCGVPGYPYQYASIRYCYKTATYLTAFDGDG